MAIPQSLNQDYQFVHGFVLTANQLEKLMPGNKPVEHNMSLKSPFFQALIILITEYN